MAIEIFDWFLDLFTPRAPVPTSIPALILESEKRIKAAIKEDGDKTRAKVQEDGSATRDAMQENHQEAIALLLKQHREQLAVLDQIIELLFEIIDLLTEPNLPPPQPGEVTLIFTKETTTVPNMILFNVPMPDLALPNDIATRKLHVVVQQADGEHVIDLEATATDTVIENDDFKAVQDTDITGSLIDVDDAGNASPARTFTVTANDSFAPPEPGEFGPVMTGEVIE